MSLGKRHTIYTSRRKPKISKDSLIDYRITAKDFLCVLNRPTICRHHNNDLFAGIIQPKFNQYTMVNSDTFKWNFIT